jgi:pimeloyl-ACP methyl ester carboxylesterase
LAAWLVVYGPAAAQAPNPPVEAKFVQVHPAPKDPGKFVRSANRQRAAVLIHGYWLHFGKGHVGQALFKDWQEKDSTLVTVLGKESDVFAFAYGQTAPLDEIAHHPSLRDGVARLKQLGYTQVVLVGHSAGGLIARHFVEDFPRAGVTKVVQVCCPNGGCSFADIKWIPSNQKGFVLSLSHEGRKSCLLGRAGKKIPPRVQFVCVISPEDHVVPCAFQWTKDLQDQGIPAIRCALGHHQVMRKTSSAKILAEVVRDPQPRWNAEQVAAARKDFFPPKKGE